MSISSEITRINNEVTAQADLISQIATALEGKAAGGGNGGSVETCTVTIPLSFIEDFGNGLGAQPYVYYTGVENGTLKNSYTPLHNASSTVAVTVAANTYILITDVSTDNVDPLFTSITGDAFLDVWGESHLVIWVSGDATIGGT